MLHEFGRDELERRIAGFERELDRLRQQVQHLKNQRAMLLQSASHQHSLATQERYQELLHVLVDTLDNQLIIAGLLDKTKKVLATSEQSQAIDAGDG